MGLPPQAARIAGTWPNTQAPRGRQPRPTRLRASRSPRQHGLTRLAHPFARPARPAGTD